jgi:hypothetical protein
MLNERPTGLGDYDREHLAIIAKAFAPLLAHSN